MQRRPFSGITRHNLTYVQSYTVGARIRARSGVGPRISICAAQRQAMAFAAEGLSLTAGFGVLPTLVVASFGDAERDSTRNDTLIFRQTQTQHCEKLFLVDDLAMMV